MHIYKIIYIKKILSELILESREGGDSVLYRLCGLIVPTSLLLKLELPESSSGDVRYQNCFTFLNVC